MYVIFTAHISSDQSRFIYFTAIVTTVLSQIQTVFSTLRIHFSRIKKSSLFLSPNYSQLSSNIAWFRISYKLRKFQRRQMTGGLGQESRCEKRKGKSRNGCKRILFHQLIHSIIRSQRDASFFMPSTPQIPNPEIVSILLHNIAICPLQGALTVFRKTCSVLISFPPGHTL